MGNGERRCNLSRSGFYHNYLCNNGCRRFYTYGWIYGNYRTCKQHNILLESKCKECKRNRCMVNGFQFYHNYSCTGCSGSYVTC